MTPQPDLTADIRDRLAVLCGWRYSRCVCDLCKNLSDDEASGWVSDDPDRAGLSPAHPFPDRDLTALAAAWPEGWRWYRLRHRYAAHPDDGWHDLARNTKATVFVNDTGNEYADRLRLTVAVLETIARESP